LKDIFFHQNKAIFHTLKLIPYYKKGQKHAKTIKKIEQMKVYLFLFNFYINKTKKLKQFNITVDFTHLKSAFTNLLLSSFSFLVPLYH